MANYLGSDFDSAVPANNTAVKLGAAWIRDIKTRLKLFFGVMFDLETGLINSSKITSAMLTVPDTLTPAVVTNGATAGSFVYARVQVNSKGQVVAGDATVGTAGIADGSVTEVKLASSAVTQAKLANAEVTSEKFTRPRKWIRFSPAPVTLGATLDRTLTTVTCDYAGGGVGLGLAAGDAVVITGASTTSLNSSNSPTGYWIVTGSDASTFTFDTVASGTVTNASGTLRFRICGSSFSLSGSAVTGTLSRSGTTVTAAVTAHGLASRDRVRISGCAEASCNGEFLVTWDNANQFRYNTTATGTVASTACSTQKLVRDVLPGDTGTAGAWSMTFATAFPDLEYMVSGIMADGGTAIGRILSFVNSTVAVGSVTLRGHAGSTGALVEDMEVSARFDS